jgi:hypothetical protein
MAGKERGFLAKIRPELDRLLAVRFFMDQDLYDRAHRPGWSNSEDPADRREGAWRPPQRSFMPKSAFHGRNPRRFPY